jgi:hypothetical protein
MPSISESPLEQDFTIEGKPSKLGCPFASMANKKLSSHAASVLSRYNHGSVGGPGSPSTSSTHRINGRDSFQGRKSGDRRSSFVDPIKAEICGLSDHDAESPLSERAMKDHVAQQASAEAGVCPIRFLDQHSPEEVATYFERHKHELPRSHEVCVKRYQSNEKQIRELDAKYGNLVSMIQGLGAKHKDMLPQEPEEGEGQDELNEANEDAAKIEQWASSVSAMGNAALDTEDHEERQPHFERPLRDIRVGESPSRPWGIPVPAKYLEAVEEDQRDMPAKVDPKQLHQTDQKPQAKCPFDHSRLAAKNPAPLPANPKPVLVGVDGVNKTGQKHDREVQQIVPESSRMVFTGPVFIGYSAEDAAKILRESRPPDI